MVKIMKNLLYAAFVFLATPGLFISPVEAGDNTAEKGQTKTAVQCMINNTKVTLKTLGGIAFLCAGLYYLFAYKPTKNKGDNNPNNGTVQQQQNLWRSTEHFFQAHKFIHNQNIFDLIRNQQTPREAFDQARQQDRIRSDWENVKFQIMLHAVYHKFLNNQELQRQLLDTGNAYLIEDSPIDHVWGIGQNRSGQNYLGKILMYVRLCLHDQKEPLKFKTAAKLKNCLDSWYSAPSNQKMINFYHSNQLHYEFTNFYMLQDNKSMHIPPCYE